MRALLFWHIPIKRVWSLSNLPHSCREVYSQLEDRPRPAVGIWHFIYIILSIWSVVITEMPHMECEMASLADPLNPHAPRPSPLSAQLASSPARGLASHDSIASPANFKLVAMHLSSEEAVFPGYHPQTSHDALYSPTSGSGIVDFWG